MWLKVSVDASLWQCAIKIGDQVISEPPPVLHDAMIENYEEGQYKAFDVPENVPVEKIERGFVDEHDRWMTREEAAKRLGQEKGDHLTETQLYGEDLSCLQKKHQSKCSG